MSLNSITRRMEKTARRMSRHHVDPETGEIMALRIKQTGQRQSGYTGVVAAMTRIDQANRTVMCGTGARHAEQIRKALNPDGSYTYTVPAADGTERNVVVTTRKHRQVTSMHVAA